MVREQVPEDGQPFADLIEGDDVNVAEAAAVPEEGRLLLGAEGAEGARNDGAVDVCVSSSDLAPAVVADVGPV